MNESEEQGRPLPVFLAKAGMVISLICFMEVLLFNPRTGLIMPLLPVSIGPGATRFASLFVLILLPVGFILSVTGLMGLAVHEKKGILAPGLTGLVLSMFVGIPMSAGYIQGRAQIRASSTPPTPEISRPSKASLAVGTFIPAIYRSDMVHDPKRNILYISAGNSVLRYQMASNSFLPPLVLGGDLRGIDISLDNDVLAVASSTDDNGVSGWYMVNLNTGTNSYVTFRGSMLEGGTHSVAFGADGCLWVTSSLHGSGYVSLRKYNPVTRAILELKSVSHETMLAASANRENIAFAQAHVSPGSYGRLSCLDSQLPKPLPSPTSLFEIGISRDGSQMAIPAFQNVIISGSAVQRLEEKDALGVVFHPKRDFVFLACGESSKIVVYETVSYKKIKELDFGDKFKKTNRAYQWGRLRISHDGAWLFCTVDGGVRYAKIDL